MKNYGYLKQKFDEELKKALALNRQCPIDKGIPLYKALIFLLERYNDGDYYGTIGIKFSGTIVQNPKEVDVTHRLETAYEEDK